MWMFMDMGEYKESELIVKQQDTWMGTPVSASSRHMTCQVNWFFFFFSFFSLPTKSYPKLPPVNNSIFIANEGKGQIMGT